MDYNKIIDLLRKTIDADSQVRVSAEKNLESIHKIISFSPTLLRAVLDQSLELHIRQSACIYLKNEILKHWEDPITSEQTAQTELLNGSIILQHSSLIGGQKKEQDQFVIHEQDKQILRDSIVDALVATQTTAQGQSLDVLSVHLTSIVYQMIKLDFPHRWPGICDKILYYLQSSSSGDFSNSCQAWGGAVIALLQLAKVYEYKPLVERRAFLDAMQILLPIVHQLLARLVMSLPASKTPEQQQVNYRLQKIILKIFHAIIQYSLPMGLLTRPVFTQWIQLIVEIAKLEIAKNPNYPDDEQGGLIEWKCKKWCLHILVRIFERYGSPGSVNKEYKEFADWYLKQFSAIVVETCIKSILEPYAMGRFIAPRVMQSTLKYLTNCVGHAFTWKMLKTDMIVIVEKIIFPLMCCSNDDIELYNDDPREYLKVKFDTFDSSTSAVVAAQNLFHDVCKKRRDILQKSMLFISNILTSSANASADANLEQAKLKDGALYLIGSIANILMKKVQYKSQIESFLFTFVLPLLALPQSVEMMPPGWLRARAFWVLNQFSEIDFTHEENLVLTKNAIVNGILGAGGAKKEDEHELPVRVEAAICLSSFLECQEWKFNELIKPTVTQLALGLVDVVVKTHNEDVMSVTQKIVCLYHDEIYVIAVKLTTDLALTFEQLISNSGDDDEEENALSAMAVLNTIDTILTMLDEQKHIVVQLESIVLKIILTIFHKSISELYEEATTLLSTITTDSISAESWTIFPILYQVFQRDGYDYFTDLMSPIHNYLTVDPQTFISNRDNLRAIYEMARTILNDANSGEETETYAAKLIEICILQFPQQIDDCIASFVELAIVRLANRAIITTELRCLLELILIAAFYYNHELFISILQKLQNPQLIAQLNVNLTLNLSVQQQQQPHALFNAFIMRWLKDIDEFCGLHDRKMCLIGLSKLAILPLSQNTNNVVNVGEVSTQIVPSILALYEKLKIAYQKKAAADSSSDSSSDVDEEDSVSEVEEDALSAEDDNDNEVEIGDDDDEYNSSDYEDYTDNDSDADDDDDDCEPTALESFETLLDTDKCDVDEFVMFRDALELIRTADINWYQILLSSLDGQQQKKLHEIGDFAARRAAEAESKRIESQGGYAFPTQDVPTTFNFTSNNSNQNNSSANGPTK